MMTEIEMSSCRRRKSVPEIVAGVVSEDDDDRDMLIGPSNINPNDLKEPVEPIYSRARLSMDGGFADHLRGETPEDAFKGDMKPDGAFMCLRSKSPVYVPQYQRHDIEGNYVDHDSASMDGGLLDHLGDNTYDSQDDSVDNDSVDNDSPTTSPYISDSEINNCNQLSPLPEFRSSKFKIVRSDSDSGRLLVKIPLDPRLNDIDEDVIFDRSTNGTTNNNADNSASYPVCLTTYKRGLNPSGQMNLVRPEQPSLNILRARTKIQYAKDVHKTIDLLKSGLSDVYRQQSIDEEHPSTSKEERDLIDIMDDSGQIIWNTEEDEQDIEDVLGLTLSEMPTMNQDEFQALDSSNIIDAYLTKDYVIIETSS